MKKIFAAFMVMVMVLTASAPVVTEAKAKTSIKVTNKATGDELDRIVVMKPGEKLQLKVTCDEKNVTKKAKYKVSGKGIKVSKKGRVAAKSNGSCSIKVTYRKMSRTIAIEVTDNKATLAYLRDPMEQKDMTVIEDGKKTTIKIYVRAGLFYTSDVKRYMKLCKVQDDPHPECDHEWEPYWFQTKTKLPGGYFTDEFKAQLSLRQIKCEKCDTYAIVSPMSVDDAFACTSEDLADRILYYDGRYKTGNMKIPDGCFHSRKEKKEYGWGPSKDGRQWLSDDRCAICGGPASQ